MTRLTRLVLFNGWGIDARIWQPLKTRLTERQQAAERERTAGPATRPIEIVTADWPLAAPDDPEAAPSHLGGADTLWLGWSLGALRAEALATALPMDQRPAALIALAMGPAFITPDHATPETTLAHRRPPAPLPALPSITLTTFQTAFARSPLASWQHFLRWQASGEPDPRDCLRQLRELIGTRPESSVDALSAGLEELATRRMSLTRAGQNLEFWLGRDDPLLAPGLAEALRDHGHQVVEYCGGHCLPLSRHDDLADALLTRMGHVVVAREEG